MRLRFTLLLSVVGCIAHAQLVVDGRRAAYDSLTKCFLATVPESVFGSDARLSVTADEGWGSVSIDGTPTSTDGTFTFDYISSSSRHDIAMTGADGQTLSATLCFTFLPIVSMTGNFGNDYERTTFVLCDPSLDSTETFPASVRWRGGTTNADGKHKRNYKVKLDEDHSLLGMRNDNNWILDAGQADVFRLRNRVAMDVWNDMARRPYYANLEPRARSGVSGRVAELFVNDEYRGVYNLSENLDRKQMRLKKIDPDTGQIRGCLYKAKTWSNTQMFGFIESYDNRSETLFGYEVKYPDLNDNDTTDWSPLVNAINFVMPSSESEFAENVEQWFDLPPLIDYLIFCSSLNALDNGGKNMFWAVYDKNTDRRLTLAPWDLDCTVGQRWGNYFESFEEDVTSPDYLTDIFLSVNYRLFELNACSFNDQMNARYHSLRHGVLSTDSLTGRYRACHQLLTKSGAAARETARWSGDSDLKGETIDFDRETQYICNWIERHMSLLDQFVFPLYLGIDEHPVVRRNSTTLYTLSGQPVSSDRPRPGIYIRNGRKIVVK